MADRFWWQGLSLFGAAVLGVSCGSGAGDPGTPVEYTRAKGVYAQGRLAESVVLLEELVRKAEDFVPGRLLLGRARFFTGDYDQARGEFQRVVQGHPGSVEGLLWWARCEFRMGNLNSAGNLLAGAAALNPDDPRLAHQWALVKEAQEDLGAARGLLEAAARFDEDLALVHFERARVAERLGDRPAAREALGRALSFLGADSPLKAPMETLRSDLDGRD